jgi:beta-glucanase (GH16 family)
MQFIENYSKQFMVVLLVLTALISGCSNGNDNSAQGGGLDNPGPVTAGVYELVWSDEFDGSTIDTNNWEVQLGDGSSEGLYRWGNDEEQYYTADNISLSDGMLTITARAGDSPDADFDYTSGRIRTEGKFDFTYGRVEASIRVPEGVGLWAAFWMLGSDPSVYGDWPRRGEIDIMESFSREAPFSQGALHYGMSVPQNQLVFKKNDTVDPTDGFHQYAVEWDIEQVRWYIDGEHYFTVRAETYWNYYYQDRETGFVAGDEAAPFNVDQHILLNMAVGGNLPGSPTDPSVFPAQMMIDYVRVYQCPVDPENTGLGCANTIDQINPFIIAEFDPADVFTASYDIYIDGLLPLFGDTGGERNFDIAVFDNSGALTVTEAVLSDGGAALEVTSTGGGNISIVDVEGGTFSLFGMGEAEDNREFGGEIKFDIKVTGGSVTDADGVLQVRFDSGFPDVGLVDLPVNSFPADEWISVSVKISDLLNGGIGAFGGAPVDIAALQSLVTFEPSSFINMQINNIRLVCGAPESCGIESIASIPFVIFDDAVNPVWERGIFGFDTIAVPDNYSDAASGNHVTWQLIDTAEEGYDTVIETTFDDNGASGVTFIGGPEDGSVDLQSYSEGELVFDIRVLSNPNNHPILFKVDSTNNTGTGEQSLGVLPLNEWTTSRVPVSVFVLLPTFVGQDVVFQWDNVRFEATTSGQAPTVQLPVDFETQGAFYNFVNFEGGVSSVIPNPDVNADNLSANVAQMIKLAAGSGATFGGTEFVLDSPIDFSSSEIITMKVWSSRPVDVLFKLVGPEVEIIITTNGTGWEQLSYDFTGMTSNDVSAVAIIFDVSVLGDFENNPDDWTFYYDDIVVSGSTGVQTGVLLDSPVEGVSFVTDTQSGITNALGEFQYIVGEVVTFSIGGIELGAAEGAAILTPVELTGSVDPTVAVAANMLVFLQSIDSDENPANGITISADAQTAAIAETLDFIAASFATDVAAVVAALTEINGDGGNAVVSETDALDEFYLTYVDIGGLDSVDFLFPGYDPVGGGSSISFTTNVENYDSSASTLGNGWITFINEFDLSGVFVPRENNSSIATPNGGNRIADISFGEAEFEQGTQYLSFYSDYADPEHATSLIETNSFQEWVIAEGDEGIYRLSFDAKVPTTDGIAAPTTAVAFITTLDPDANFSRSSYVEVDIASISSSQWTSISVDLPAIDIATFEGHILQMGFSNRATNQNPSRVYVDNIVFGELNSLPGLEPNPLLDGSTGATGDALSISFDDETIMYGFGDLGDATTVTAMDPIVGSENIVAATNKSAIATALAGATVIESSGIVYPLTATASQMTVRVFSPTAGIPVRLKLEEAADANRTVETETMTTVAGDWETLIFDFNVEVAGTAVLNPSYTFDTLSIFFNYGTDGATAGDQTYYWDTIEFSGEGSGSGSRTQSTVPVDFESSLIAYLFTNEGGGAASVIDNPQAFGINTSAKVAQMQKFDGTTSGGSSLGLDEAVDFSGGEIFSMKVFSDRAVQVTFKLDDLSIERQVRHNGTGWENMIFDFRGATSTGATTITVIFDDGMLGDADNQPADWTFYVDDIELYTTTPSIFDYSQDFEALLSADDDILGFELGIVGGEQFRVFAAVFDNADDSFDYQYGAFTAPNGGPGFSAIAANGEGGVDQGDQYINIYSDYNNADHGNDRTLVTSVFKEDILAAESSNTVIYNFSFDAKAPLVDDGIADATLGATAQAYIKTIDPNNGFATTNVITVDMTGIDNTDWAHFSISIELDSAALAGQTLQFGWDTTATGFDPSGVYYDNLKFIVLEPAPQ